MIFPITLSKLLFHNGKNDHIINLDIPEPKLIHFKDRTTRIKVDCKGVYVIFDSMGDDNWENPNPPELHGEKRHCLYVGEGIIRTRLNQHNYSLVGKYAKDVVYYDVPDIADRKLLERLLIKHYIPIFNKEGQYTHSIKKSFIEKRDNYLEEIISEINAMQREAGLEPKGQEVIEILFKEEDMTLNEIYEGLWSIIHGLEKESTQHYEELRQRN